MVTYTLKVADIRKETEDTLTLCFKQPALRKIKYKAGQYLSFIFRINGRRYVRPYSFSSSPSVDSLIEVTIKRVSNGIVSNHIHDKVQIGEAIEVIEPMGDFVHDTKSDIEAVYFWGIGSGITPLISIIKELLFSTEKISVNLIYGNRNFDTTIFSNQIKLLRDNYPNQFKVWHFHTQLTLRESNQYIVEGRINQKDALGILGQIDGSKTEHYICGPTGLKESVKEALGAINVLPSRIFSEDFEMIKDPKDFEDIHTQVIKLRFENREHTLEIIKGKSILESGLDAGLELPYSCQTGSCSTCKARRVAGELKMVGLTKERLDLEQSEYLLCCSHPLSNDVFIEV